MKDRLQSQGLAQLDCLEKSLPVLCLRADRDSFVRFSHAEGLPCPVHVPGEMTPHVRIYCIPGPSEFVEPFHPLVDALVPFAVGGARRSHCPSVSDIPGSLPLPPGLGDPHSDHRYLRM